MPDTIATTSAKQEWSHIDKSSWPYGEWRDEPDKVQWRDEATGLHCVMLRNPSGGNWCGYIGLVEGHPLYNAPYNKPIAALAEALEQRKQEPIGESPSFAVLLACMGCDLETRPDTALRAHGGITYSDFGYDPAVEQWERCQVRATDPVLRERAAGHPKGDSARVLAFMEESAAMSYEDWRAREWKRRICWNPETEAAPTLWFFGFDCAHHGDHSPAYSAEYSSFSDGIYRDRAYVEAECANLAAQLAAVSA